VKSHVELPVSGSSALMPALGAGWPASRAAGVEARPRPMYCWPRTIGAGALTYCWPASEYARYSQPVSGLYDGAWKFVAPPSVGYTRKLPSSLELDPGTGCGRPFASNPVFQFWYTNGVPERNAPLVRPRM